MACRWRFYQGSDRRSDDPMAMAAWALNWSGALDLETKMVLDDAETRALGQQKIAREVQ